MLCPHCGRTIPEQDEYLMSVRNRDLDWQPWMTWALCFLLFLIMTGVMVTLNHAAG